MVPRPILEDRHDPRCAACGMELRSWAEYHPFTACDLYKLTHNSRAVRAWLCENPPQMERSA
jgi:hypothetical protein